MEHVNAARKSIAAAFTLVLACVSNLALAAPQESCLTQTDLQAVQQNFFAHFPDANAFRQYADKSKFRLLTNAASGRDLEQNGKPTADKIDWLVGTMNDHKELFSNFAFDKPDFTYMKGQLKGGKPSVDNLRTSKRFPANECVQEVTYAVPSGACAMGQRLTDLSVTFVKDEHPLSLRSVEMYFDACPVK